VPPKIDGHRELQGADTGLELPAAVAVEVALPGAAALVRGGLQVLGHLGVEEALKRHLDQLAQEVWVAEQRCTRR